MRSHRSRWETARVRGFVEELEGLARIGANTAATLEEAFARIACRCGLSYRFVAFEGGWALEMTDVERPDRSPEAIISNYKRPQDAQHDLMTQAIDGRIRGHVAIRHDLFGSARMRRTAKGADAHIAQAAQSGRRTSR